MNLASLQQAMRGWLETGDPDCAARFGESARPGLDVYLNNYRMQLLQCLDEVFPRTLAWLGETRFHAAARHHIMTRPPTAWTLDAYPATFAAAADTLFAGDRVTIELAQLELALDEAQTAADRPPLTRAMFTRLDWEQVALTHASGGHVLRHHTNATAIWSALSRPDEAPEDLSPVADADRAPVDILVWRNGWIPCFRTLDPDEADILAAMTTAPQPFTAICAQLEHTLGAEAAIARAGLLLARWADDEAVSVAA